jgi:predicted DNA-binding transcriptional regulator
MSKDQVIGSVITAVCVIVALAYVVLLFFYPNIQSLINIGSTANVHFWVIAVPVAVAFIAILGIGGWIGYTMATTPPPKPIEEITTEINNEKTQNTQ